MPKRRNAPRPSARAGKPDDVRKLAEAIAADLFTEGQTNEKADRLALVNAGREDQPARGMSGWGERAMADRIEQHLRKAVSHD